MLWGELITVAVKNKEISDLVIDGGISDCNEIEEIDFPVFSKGVNARGGYKTSPGSIIILFHVVKFLLIQEILLYQS